MSVLLLVGVGMRVVVAGVDADAVVPTMSVRKDQELRALLAIREEQARKIQAQLEENQKVCVGVQR